MNRTWILFALTCVGGLGAAGLGSASCGGAEFVASTSTSSGSGGEAAGSGGSSATAGGQATGSGGDTSGSGGGSSTSGSGGGSSTSGSGGGSSASSSSASSSSASSSSASSSSGNPGNEDCDNGVDDNNNGKIDCADPACGGIVQCVGPAVLDWTGPAVIKFGDPGTLGSCAPVWQSEALRNADLLAPDASCGCSCNAAGVCSTFLSQSVVGCNGLGGAGVSVPDNSCVSTPNALPVLGATAGPPVVGSCAPVPSVGIQPATWDVQALICVGSSAAGCSGGMACVPTPTDSQKVCVFRTGDFACPAGYPLKKITFGDALVDTRGCSACGCGAAVGADCNGKVQLFSAANCPNGASVGSAATNGQCTPFPALTQIASYMFDANSSGSCPPSGGQPTGSVSGTMPATVCCQ